MILCRYLSDLIFYWECSSLSFLMTMESLPAGITTLPPVLAWVLAFKTQDYRGWQPYPWGSHRLAQRLPALGFSLLFILYFWDFRNFFPASLKIIYLCYFYLASSNIGLTFRPFHFMCKSFPLCSAETDTIFFIGYKWSWKNHMGMLSKGLKARILMQFFEFRCWKESLYVPSKNI